MTPEAIFQFTREFGLPIAILGVGLWMFLTGRIVTRRELDDVKTQYERERTDRIAAEANLAKFAGANAEVAEAVREVLSEVVRKDSYQERLAGSPRRGR